MMGRSVSGRRTTRRSLFRRYLLVLVVLVGTVLVVSGGVQSYVAYRQSRTDLGRIQQGEAAIAADRIAQFITSLVPPITAANTTLRTLGASTPEQRQAEYQRLFRQVPEITDLRYLDANGREQVAMHRLDPDVLGSQDDGSAEEPFAQARNSSPWYGPVTFRNDSEPYMAIAVADGPPDGGVTVVNVNLKFLWDVIAELRVGRSGVAYVVDAGGQLLAHPDLGLVLQARNLSALPQVRAAQRATARQGGADAVVGQDPRTGAGVFSAYAAVSPPGWFVFADVPQGEAFAPLYAALQRAALLLGAGLALAVVASALLARRMVTPIRALQAGAARIGGGALDQPIVVRTGDELEALAEEFNRMSARLQQSHAELEHRVDERTRDLSTALAQLDQQRIALELANHHKSAFLAAMSHELRTPLHAVINFSQVLLARMWGELTPKQEQYLGDILSSGQHLLDLISDLLDLAKIEAGRMELEQAPFSLPAAVEACLAMVRERAARQGVALSLDVDGSVDCITADELRLRQVLLNLLTNAVKFTPAGGSVAVEVRGAGDSVTIAVRDTGIGIAPADQEAIFEEFRQAGTGGEREGTGLGLALSRRFVQLHGGRLEVESTLGEGSTFTVTLPREPGASPAAAAPLQRSFA